MSFFQQSRMIKAQTTFQKKKYKYDKTQAEKFLFKQYNDRLKRRAVIAAASNITFSGTPQLIEEDEEQILNEELEAALVTVSMRDSTLDYNATSQHIANRMNFFNQTRAIGMSMISYMHDHKKAGKGL